MASSLWTRRNFLRAMSAAPIAGAAPFGWIATAHAADNWPSKPVRLMVGFPPGGGADGIARLVGRKLEMALGQSFVVETRTAPPARSARPKSHVPPRTAIRCRLRISAQTPLRR